MSWFPNGIYSYKRTAQPDGSGMAVMAFVPNFGLPLFMTSGPGTPYPFQWNSMQPPQQYHNLEQQQIGMQGVLAGQIAMQPLIDNRGVTG